MSDDGESLITRIREVLNEPQTGPSLRRFFVTTIFDSTFVLIGIVIGSAIAHEARLNVLITTILTSTVAMGISTGVSIFEAERLERSIRMREVERAMLTSLEGTDIHKASLLAILVIALINFFGPIMAGLITLAPFLLLPQAQIQTAAWIAVALDLTLLFVVGAVMGYIGERNPLVQGARMAIIGVAVFIICYLIGAVV